MTLLTKRSYFTAAILVASLTACTDGANPGPAEILSNPDEQASNDPVPPITDSGDCAYVLDSDIRSPTELVNTSSYCDYELDGWVDVSSLLRIQPGVVIQATPNARLVLDGGEIQAIGTAENRIVFEGASHVQGYWRGLDIDGGRGATFDYVDVKDAGQVCSILFCPDVGFYVGNISFSFTNSSVSNSYVFGMSIAGDVNIVAFENNRFYGNALAGLSVAGEQVPALDAASDYIGVGAENGLPAVSIHSGEQTKGEIFEWKKLNAPYLIRGYFNVAGGIMRLEAGTELLFGSEAWMTVEGNGVFQALGTAGNPVSIRGYVESPGYWDGIRFRESNWDNNQLQYTTISHSGETDGLVSAYAAISLYESRISLSNSTFSDNARWGIVCNDPDHPYIASVIHDGGGNTFSRNESGHVDSDCQIQ